MLTVYDFDGARGSESTLQLYKGEVIRQLLYLNHDSGSCHILPYLQIRLIVSPLGSRIVLYCSARGDNNYC